MMYIWMSIVEAWHMSKQYSIAEAREHLARVIQEAAAELAAAGREPVGVEAILKMNPKTRPVKSRRSPAPLFHAATKAMRKALWEAYALFVAAFREAADRLRSGDRNARFQVGSFPPGLPFVSGDAPGPP